MCLPCVQSCFKLLSLVVALVSVGFIAWSIFLLTQDPWEPVLGSSPDGGNAPCTLIARERVDVSLRCDGLEAAPAACASSVAWCDGSSVACTCTSSTRWFARSLPCSSGPQLDATWMAHACLESSDVIRTCWEHALHGRVLCEASQDKSSAYAQLVLGLVLLVLLEPLCLFFYCFVAGRIPVPRWFPVLGRYIPDDSDSEDQHPVKDVDIAQRASGTEQ